MTGAAMLVTRLIDRGEHLAQNLPASLMTVSIMSGVAFSKPGRLP